MSSEKKTPLRSALSDSWCRNISDLLLNKLSNLEEAAESPHEFDDSANAFWYIVFVLSFYAISIVILLVKYIRKERDHTKLSFYYDEFVKREAFKWLVADPSGRIIGHPHEIYRFKVDATKTAVVDDPDEEGPPCTVALVGPVPPTDAEVTSSDAGCEVSSSCSEDSTSQYDEDEAQRFFGKDNPESFV